MARTIYQRWLPDNEETARKLIEEAHDRAIHELRGTETCLICGRGVWGVSDLSWYSDGVSDRHTCAPGNIGPSAYCGLHFPEEGKTLDKSHWPE